LKREILSKKFTEKRNKRMKYVRDFDITAERENEDLKWFSNSEKPPDNIETETTEQQNILQEENPEEGNQI
jgi:hypothetical protein